MARLPRSGTAFSSLYEYEATLAEVISSLGFRPLSKKEEATVRNKMGYAIGQWAHQEGDHQETGAKLNIEDIQQSLSDLSARLDQVADVLVAVEQGIHHIHAIEVVGQLSKSLAENPEIGSVEKAHEFLADFHGRARTVAHSADVAGWLLSTLPRKHGRIRQDWHDEFTRAVMHVCELNRVATTIPVDRVTREAKGKFLEAGLGLERLLHPRMRAPSAVALAQRLERSKKKVNKG